MFYRLGRFAARYRWWIVGVWMVAMALALPFAPRASAVLQSGGFISPDAESQRALDLLTRKLNLKSTVVQIIFTSQTYTADDPRFAQEAERALANLRSWSQVESVTSFTDNPRQISLDRHAAYANITLKTDADSAPGLLPELERRLTGRAQDSAQEIAKRMAKASDEMSHWAEYDYVIVNRDVDEAVAKVHGILNAERLRRRRQVGLSEFVKGLQAGV